jgi:hypothetical protein
MASFVARSLTSAAVLAYGLFTVVLYGCIAIKRGTFFQRVSEKEKLELQLGECCYSSTVSVTTMLPLPYS